MSDSKIDVARVELRDGYTIDGKAERWLLARDFALGYEPDTDVLVVQRRGSDSIHVIPWANVLGFELDRKKRAPEVKQEAANGRPAGAGAASGGSRRTRPTP